MRSALPLPRASQTRPDLPRYQPHRAAPARSHRRGSGLILLTTKNFSLYIKLETKPLEHKLRSVKNIIKRTFPTILKYHLKIKFALLILQSEITHNGKIIFCKLIEAIKNVLFIFAICIAF